MKIRHVLLLIFLGFAAWTAYEVKFFPDRPLQNTYLEVDFKKGSGVKGIVAELQEKHVSGDTLRMKVYLSYRNFKVPLKAGEYQFNAGITPRQIADKLAKGEKIRRTFTIPEGYSVREIAKVLASKNLVEPESFIKKCLSFDAAYLSGVEGNTLEGYLFPDTYEYTKGMNEDQIIRMMVENFKKKFSEKMKRRAHELKMTVNQVITLASVIEKETGKEEERPLVASVFYNRLAKGIPLATDPSVIYGIPNFDGNLRREDLQRDTPYNTYIRKGLPPTPISNPGLKSIEAALNPAETEYLYFVSRNDGTHQFSKTYEEHQSAVKKYQPVKTPSPQIQ